MRSPCRSILAAAALLLALAAPLSAQQSQAQQRASRATLETRIRALLAGVVGSGQMQARLAEQSLSLYDSLRALPAPVDTVTQTVIKTILRTDTVRIERVDTVHALPLDRLRRVRWALPDTGWAWIAVDSAGVEISRDSIRFGPNEP